MKILRRASEIWGLHLFSLGSHHQNLIGLEWDYRRSIPVPIKNNFENHLLDGEISEHT